MTDRPEPFGLTGSMSETTRPSCFEKEIAFHLPYLQQLVLLFSKQAVFVLCAVFQHTITNRSRLAENGTRPPEPANGL
jgi:hypothetical protein